MSESGARPGRAGGWMVWALAAAGAVIVALVVVVMVLVVGRPDGSPAHDGGGGGEAAKTFTASGQLTLIDSSVEHQGRECWGAGGYDDITAGAQVVVRDAAGKSLAVGQLGTGEVGDYTSMCIFAFEVPGVPSGAGPYSVEVSHRGQISFTEVTASGLDLTLG